MGKSVEVVNPLDGEVLAGIEIPRHISLAEGQQIGAQVLDIVRSMYRFNDDDVLEVRTFGFIPAEGRQPSALPPIPPSLAGGRRL